MARKGFTLSPRERSILADSEARIDADRRAVLVAKTMIGPAARFRQFKDTFAIGDYLRQIKSKVRRSEDNVQHVVVHGSEQTFVTLNSVMARMLGCDASFIKGFQFHDTSVSVRVDQEVFKQEWQKINSGMKITDRNLPLAVSGYKVTFYLDGKEYTLPVSLINNGRANYRTAEHENVHIQYEYFNPEDTVSYDSISLKVREIAASGNLNLFRSYIQEVANGHLSGYLDELAAHAINRETGVFEGFFENRSDLYSQSLRDMQEALSLGVSVSARIEELQSIIARELAKAKLRARYIDDRYKLLLRKGLSGEQLTNIILFLTPEQGYLINAYLQDKPPTISQMKAWMTEYKDLAA